MRNENLYNKLGETLPLIHEIREYIEREKPNEKILKKLNKITRNLEEMENELEATVEIES